jgi:chromosome segregation ATPase
LPLYLGPMNRRAALLAALLMGIAGCQSTYYATMAKFGYEKRDLLKKAVVAARNEQQEAQEEFKDAMTRLKELYGFEGGDLEKKYSKLKADYDDCTAQSKDVNKRIKEMDQIANDLFLEWDKEIGTMSNSALASDSRRKLSETRSRYNGVSHALHQAEAAMEPVLRQFSDHVLYLKHNLNAAAIGSLRGEATNIQNDIDRLINQMNSSINEADAFIKSLQ